MQAVVSKRDHVNTTIKWYREIGRNRYRFRVVRYDNGKTVCVAERNDGHNRWAEIHNLTFRKG